LSATVDELVLDAESDAVPRARRFVVETLVDAPELQREDAELVVAELVTNAVLHGAPPVVVRVHRRPDVVRVEVRDVGRQLPIAMRGSEDAMTGRGLRLVGCLSRRWGVQPADEGSLTKRWEQPMRPTSTRFSPRGTTSRTPPSGCSP
jgi:anti-sigma regulatory factor (Ser/Thr protein kinase)